MEDLIALSYAEKRHELVLTGEEVGDETALPDSAFKLSGLNFLQVANSSLSSISPQITRLHSLAKLILHSNALTELPTEIGQLSKLKHLDVSRNELKELPESLAGLKDLHIFNVAHNHLTSLPDLSASGERLTELLAGYNDFEAIPDWVTSEAAPTFIHLATVDFSHCRVPALQPEIARLTGLKLLDLSANLLTALPGELADSPRMKELRLADNKLTDRRLGKLIADSHSKTSTLMDYIRKNCARAGGGGGGKGKKGKGKGKDAKKAEPEPEALDDSQPRIVVSLASDDHKVVTTSDGQAARAHILCCVVSGLDLSGEGALRKFLQLQNKLHEAEEGGRKRQAATIATHDLGAVRFPLAYSALAPEALRIWPLRGTAESSGAELVSRLNEEAEAQRKKEKRSTFSGIHKYLYLLKNLERYPALLDDEQRVISFPPITNSDLTKLSPETTSILVEVSSSESQAVCRKVLALLLSQMLGAGISADADALRVFQVKVTKEDGTVHATYPDKNDLAGLPGIAVIRDWQ